MVIGSASHTVIIPGYSWQECAVVRALAKNSLQFIADYSNRKISEVTAQEKDRFGWTQRQRF